MSRYSDLHERTAREVPFLIECHREGPYWDYKKQWYEKPEDLMHDILCLANNLESEFSYLIIGIDEENNYEICDVETNSTVHRFNNQSIVDKLSKSSWGSECAPYVQVEPLSIEGKTIDVVSILSNRAHMPYYLCKPSGKVKPWVVYTRRGDQNTPIDQGANWSEVQDIWSHHFGLDSSPLVRFKNMLKDKTNWEYIADTEDMYYRFAPEFTLVQEFDESRTGYEFYMLEQTDPEPQWYKIELRYYQTPIYASIGIALDGGRYFAPVPNERFLRWDDNLLLTVPDLSYVFYEKDSIEWALNEFFFNDGNSEATYSRNCFLDSTLVFEDRKERLAFEQNLRRSRKTFEEASSKIKIYDPTAKLPETYSDEGKTMMLNHIRVAKVLKKLLEEFRLGTLLWDPIETSRKW